ncbi:helix-turn-helix domain-containing protein [Kaistella haifensis]|nr:helix-turn-helix domain-containing protein [Kaistella haifensis]
MKKIILFLLFSLSFTFCFSQSTEHFKIPDSLKTKSFQYLENTFDKVLKPDPKNAEILANTILAKGKNEADNTKVAKGYLFLYQIKSVPVYLDSMIVISRKFNDFDNLALGYLHKGNYYYSLSDYSNALENYLSARDFSRDNPDTYQITNFNIGLLKLELGNYQEALQLFLQYEKFLTRTHQIERLDYLRAMYAIAYTYSKMDKLEWSDSYIQTALEKCRKNNNGKEICNNLSLVSGINQYKRKAYQQAIATLGGVSKSIRENAYTTENLALSEFYIGMSLFRKNDIKYIDRFINVDSINITTKSSPSEVREIYPILIEHYKQEGDKEKQLFYIEHLLEFDSILNKTNHNLSVEINNKYDTPNLLKEKEQLISDLNSKNSVLFAVSGIIGLLSMALLFLYYKNRKKIKHYKEEAMHLAKNPKYIFLESIAEVDKGSDNIIKDQSKTKLSKELLSTLSLKFNKFEDDKGFLNRNLTLDSLAKEFQTNRDYLSKAVKELKDKSFSQYINELRIKYVIEELKTNPKLRRLTVAGIAEEAGFNNSESFASAFKKITGTLPSYYLKALKQV